MKSRLEKNFDGKDTLKKTTVYLNDGSIHRDSYYLNGKKYVNRILDCLINMELCKGKFIENNGSLWVRE